ncbi:hypothetical protein NUW58_g7638 [Xylaria curta]|uniref:Uncharacterized protein n=1 Tax=Xylaria curta TaxID=42375 RepID=A0ACC1NGG8_9PEZI|nr:hypothetical protein NUW58_g7638 [Xylaria curta]
MSAQQDLQDLIRLMTVGMKVPMKDALSRVKSLQVKNLRSIKQIAECPLSDVHPREEPSRNTSNQAAWLWPHGGSYPNPFSHFGHLITQGFSAERIRKEIPDLDLLDLADEQFRVDRWLLGLFAPFRPEIATLLKQYLKSYKSMAGRSSFDIEYIRKEFKQSPCDSICTERAVLLTFICLYGNAAILQQLDTTSLAPDEIAHLQVCAAQSSNQEIFDIVINHGPKELEWLPHANMMRAKLAMDPLFVSSFAKSLIAHNIPDPLSAVLLSHASIHALLIVDLPSFSDYIWNLIVYQVQQYEARPTAAGCTIIPSLVYQTMPVFWDLKTSAEYLLQDLRLYDILNLLARSPAFVSSLDTPSLKDEYVNFYYRPFPSVVGYTALMIALHCGMKPAVQILVDAGASILKIASCGKSALSVARENTQAQHPRQCVTFSGPIYDGDTSPEIMWVSESVDKEMLEVLLKALRDRGEVGEEGLEEVPESGKWRTLRRKARYFVWWLFRPSYSFDSDHFRENSIYAVLVSALWFLSVLKVLKVELGEFPSHAANILSRPAVILAVVVCLGTSTSNWSATVFEPGQNAISTLLHPPILRSGLESHTSAAVSGLYNAPTAQDIPPVALTNIQRVNSDEFKPYISKVGALYEQLRRVQGREDGLRAKQECQSDDFKDNKDPSGSLSIIPGIYFDEKFHLQNPRTFNIVSERSDVIPPSNENVTAPRKALATNAILQEKLSWYMDIAEMLLIDSISIASANFLSALNSLRELHSEAAELVKNVKTLRKDLVSLDEGMITGAGKALSEIEAVELLMAGVRDETSGDKALLNSQLQDLRGTTLLQGVASDLTILRFRTGEVFAAQLHSLLIEDLRRHIQSISIQEVLSRWEASSLRAKGGNVPELGAFPAFIGMTDELRSTLSSVVSGLYRSGSVSAAILVYRELVLQEIRNIVRKPLPYSAEDAESVTSTSGIGGGPSRPSQEKSSIVARHIRALNAEDAERLFPTIFVGVIETIRRVKTQSSTILDIACTIENTGTEDPVKSPTVIEFREDMHGILDVPNLLGQAVDISHERINEILRVRSEQTISLPLTSFLRYFALNLLFVNECEAISGQVGTSLKAIVNDHIQDYITAHGDKENKALAQGMSSDNWQDKDFTAKDNAILGQILECSTSDPPAWAELNKISATFPREETESDCTADSTKGDKVRGAIIDKETFLLPSSAILCLEGISHFFRLISGIPSMTSDITATLISYLQTFDSRCRQLVLGAGAMLSAGLKNITTTNLVVALQAVTFIATIVPYIREFIRRHAPAGHSSANLVGEFDKVLRALQEHQEGICEKLVEIMASRARIYSKKAREIEWSKEKAEDVRGYMVDLARDTSKLYKALSKRRPAWVVAKVMVPVFASYKEQMGSVFKQADAETEASRDCMLRDVGYLTNKLGEIEGFGDLGTFLVKIIEDKTIRAGEIVC